MILSDKSLAQLIDSNDLIIRGVDGPIELQPASIDFHLGNKFLFIRDSVTQISLDEEIFYDEVDADVIVIPPSSFVLATTEERISLPNNVVAFVEGRSSIGRLGLFIENAGWIDPGFDGKITLELYNASSVPIRLERGRRICQLIFCKMDQPCEFPYKGKYQGQGTVTGSRIHLDGRRNNETGTDDNG